MAHTWSEIKDHSCGRYKEEMDRVIDTAHRNHKRFMHYFERWKGHADSHKKEKADRQVEAEASRSGESARRTCPRL
jgi:ariadne-1